MQKLGRNDATEIVRVVWVDKNGEIKAVDGPYVNLSTAKSVVTSKRDRIERGEAVRFPGHKTAQGLGIVGYRFEYTELNWKTLEI